MNPHVAIDTPEFDINLRGDDADISEVVTSVNPTDTPDHSKTESIMSSASKSEENPRSQKQLAGIDMRVGEYREVKFPPVLSTIVAHKPMEAMKERTPSPVDLCTTKHSEKKKFPKSVPKLPASCTISEDPHDVQRYVPKSTTMQLKLTQAHHVAERSRLSPKLGDPTGSFISACPPADSTVCADWTSNIFQRRPQEEVVMGTYCSDQKVKKQKRKRTTSNYEDLIVILPERNIKSTHTITLSTKSRLIYSPDDTGNSSLSPTKNRRTGYSFQFGGSSRFSSTPAISALQSLTFCSANVTGDSRSAFSTLRSTLSGTATRNPFSFIRSLQTPNLKTFCSIFTGSTKISRNRNEDKMIGTVGDKEATSQNDSGIDVTERRSTKEDVKFLGASDKASPKQMPGYGDYSEDDNVDLSVEDDNKGHEIDIDEENKLLGDDDILKIHDGQEDMTISVNLSESIHHVTAKELVEIPPQTPSSVQSSDEQRRHVSGNKKDMGKMKTLPHTEVNSMKIQESQPMGDKSSIEVRDEKEEVSKKSDKPTEVHSCSSSSCSLCYSSDETLTSSGSSTLPFEKLSKEMQDDSKGDSTPEESSDNSDELSGNEVEEKESQQRNQKTFQYDANFDSGVMAVLKTTRNKSKDKSSKDQSMTSPKSREKRVKDYMASIGAGGVQAKITSHTEEPEKKEDKLKHKLEEIENYKNSEDVKKKKNKSIESKAENKKSSHKSHGDTEGEETSVDNDESNKPPEGQDFIDDKEFEKIFLGKYINFYLLFYF